MPKPKTTAAAAAPQPSVIDDLEAALAREAEITARIADMRAEIERLGEENSAMRTPMADLDDKLRDTRQRLESEERRTGEDNPVLRERAASLEASLNRMRTTFDENEARRVKLNEELWRLEVVDLPAARTGGALAHVLAQQSRSAEAEAKVAALEKLIGEQQAALAAVELQDTARFAVELEDLHAAVATGTVTESEHDKREAQIVAERTEAQRMNEAAAGRRERLAGAISGLERQLEAATAELDAQRDKVKPVLVRFLNSEGERMQAEYAAQAEKLVDLFLRLLAMQGIAREAGSGQRLLYESSNEMVIPAAFAAPDKPSAVPYERGFLFRAANAIYGSTNPVTAKAREEVERLQAMGVEL